MSLQTGKTVAVAVRRNESQYFMSDRNWRMLAGHCNLQLTERLAQRGLGRVRDLSFL